MTEADDLQMRLREIEDKERELARREQSLAARSIRHNLYDRIDVSPKTLDIIIVACVLAIAILVAVGVLMGKSPQ